MESIQKLDPESICRVCLQEKPELFLIFDETYGEDGAPISKILSECTRYRVERHDEMPHQICVTCMIAARDAYRFKRQTEKAYCTLLGVLHVNSRKINDTSGDGGGGGCGCGGVDISTQTEKMSIHPCELCGEKFFDEVDLRDHRLLEHRGDAKSCRICGDTFLRIRQLRTHLAQEHPAEGQMYDIKCPVCLRQFSRKDHVRRHMRFVHKHRFDRTKPNDIDSKEVASQGEVMENSNNSFNNEEEMSEADDSLHPDDSEKAQDGLRKCQICDERFDTKRLLSVHLVQKHPNDESVKNLNMKCPVCQRQFSRKDHVVRHMRNVHKISEQSAKLLTNQGKTEFKAEEEEVNWLKHDDALEEDENPLLDTKPEDSFMQQKDGKIICRVCDEIFNNLTEFKSHLAQAHPKLVQSNNIHCPLCQRQFKHKQHMQRHMVNVHKQNWESTKVSLEEPEIDFKVSDTKQNRTTAWFNYADDSSDAEMDMDATNPFSSDDDEKVNETELSIKVEPNDDFDSDSSSNVKTYKLPLKVKKSSGGDGDCNDDTTFEEMADGDTKPSPVASNQKVKIIREYLVEKTGLRRTRRRGEQKNPENRCEECQRTFSRHCHLRRHMLTHLDEKPHACMHCSKRFTRSDHLKTHIMNLHNAKDFKCDQCNVAFARSDALMRHKEARHGDEPNAHKIHDCEYCDKKFTSKTYLRKHTLMHTDRIFACKFCEETYKDRKAFRDHEKTHSVQRNFLCSVCGESFVRNDYLRVHMRRHTGEKPYKCQYCGKGFPRATDVKMHERYHTGTKPKICTLCGKGFHRAYNLTIHMRTHTGERPFKCDQCPKSFTQSNDLKAHIRRHTGERFKCTECDSAFLQLYGLRQHALGVHGIQIESTTGRLQKFLPPVAVEQLPEHQQHQQQQSLQQRQIASMPVQGPIGNQLVQTFHIPSQPTDLMQTL